MHGNETDPAAPRFPESVEPRSQGGLYLSVKLQEKLEKLARWRIDPSLIKFPEDATEFGGGHSTVSKALLDSSFIVQGMAEKSEHAVDERSSQDAPNPGSRNDTRDLGDRGEGVDPSQENYSDGTNISPAAQEETANSENHDAASSPPSQPPKPKNVAVKKLKIEKDADVERVLGLALRESKFLLELSHQNIITIEGIVEDASKHTIWLVFPWEENGNLRDFLASGEFEIPERISLIYDVAKGLEYLHSQKSPIYHGDLKSLNILVNSDYLAVITDFGSARRLAHEEHAEVEKGDESKPQSGPDLTTAEENTLLRAVFCATTNTITLTGNHYTLRWAAPELLSEDRPTLASDIWALGWIAYEVMTESIPFHDVKKDTLVVKRVIQGDLPSITDHARMSLSRDLCSLMAQCWNGNPNQRPTAEDCRKLLGWMPMIVPAPTQTMDPEVSQTRHAQLLVRLGRMYRRQGDYSNAINCYKKSLASYPTSSESEGRADALLGLAHVHRFQGEYNEAKKLYFEAMPIYTDLGAPVAESRADTLWSLAEVNRLQGETDKAVELYSESIQIYTDLGSRDGRAQGLWGLAEIHRSQSRYSEATEFYSEALEIHRDLGDKEGAIQNLWSIAEVHRLQGEYDDAFKFFSETLQLSIDFGSRYWRAYSLVGLADLFRHRGEFSEAITFYTEALQIRSDIGDKPGIADRSLMIHRLPLASVAIAPSV